MILALSARCVIIGSGLRHDMETISALPALCEGKPPVDQR